VANDKISKESEEKIKEENKEKRKLEIQSKLKDIFEPSKLSKTIQKVVRGLFISLVTPESNFLHTV
jgi:hypothetical protein